MRLAGCRQVLIGLESPAGGPLQGIEARSNFKARTAGGYLAALRRIQSHGITVNGCFILGLDGHTPKIFEDVLTFARQVPLYDVQITGAYRVSRHAAVRPATRGRADPRAGEVGPVHALRRELRTAWHVGP